MARRYRSLHFNLKEDANVVFHREHRSPRNRTALKKGVLQKYKRSDRRRWKAQLGREEYLIYIAKKNRKKKRY